MSRFVIKEHHAHSPHWDFCLEVDGVLKSWALPDGPSMDSRHKRIAIEVPDHDIHYVEYEGIIPDGQVGAGPVMILDVGTYELINQIQMDESLLNGRLYFRLHGQRLKGLFSLVRNFKNNTEWFFEKCKDSQDELGWQIPHLLTRDKLNSLEVKETYCALIEEWTQRFDPAKT